MAAESMKPDTDEVEELRGRLHRVEDLANANHRELETQFRRIAEMQAQIDRLLRHLPHK